MQSPTLNGKSSIKYFKCKFQYTLKIKFKNPSDFLKYYLIYVPQTFFKLSVINLSQDSKTNPARKIKLKRFMIILF